jgi:hypothetical protein
MGYNVPFCPEPLYTVHARNEAVCVAIHPWAKGGAENLFSTINNSEKSSFPTDPSGFGKRSFSIPIWKIIQDSNLITSKSQ